MERAFENIVVDSHNIRLQEEKDREVKKDRDQKAQYKDVWERQMQINQEKKVAVNTKAWVTTNW